MEQVVYGNLHTEGMEVVRREGRYFVRYDAGNHQTKWREDELSEQEFERLRASRYREDVNDVILDLQRRLIQQGEDPYAENWSRP